MNSPSSMFDAVWNCDPGESLKFAAVVEGVQPGLGTFEVQAQSPRNLGNFRRP